VGGGAVSNGPTFNKQGKEVISLIDNEINLISQLARETIKKKRGRKKKLDGASEYGGGSEKNKRDQKYIQKMSS
jgi:hypothetical protein